jgi:hypothetical protein
MSTHGSQWFNHMAYLITYLVSTYLIIKKNYNIPNLPTYLSTYSTPHLTYLPNLSHVFLFSKYFITTSLWLFLIMIIFDVQNETFISLVTFQGFNYPTNIWCDEK